MKNTFALLTGLLLVLTAPVAMAQGTFEDLPLDPYFIPYYMTLSYDGSVLGGGAYAPFIMTEENGVQFINTAPYGDFTADNWGNISEDGSTLAFNVLFPDQTRQAAYYSAEDGVVLIPGTQNATICGEDFNGVYATNGDGTQFVGLGYYNGCEFGAFNWTKGDANSVFLNDTGAGARANDISSDGGLIGGWIYQPGGYLRLASVWVDGELEVLSDRQSEILAVSPSGAKAAGMVETGGIYWTAESGAMDIGTLPGDENWGARANSVSDNGVVVGMSGNMFFATPRGFVWTEELGMTYAGDYFTLMGVTGHEGLPISNVVAISGDGTTFAGTYTTGPGMHQPFIVRLTGTVGVTPGEDEIVEDSIPTASYLMGAFPNPFNPMTTVKFSLDRAQHVSLQVYDVNGRLVTDMADRVFEAGEHSFVWQGRDMAGRSLPSGNYLLRMATETAVETSKMMLVR